MSFVEINKLFDENERLKKEAARLAGEVSRLRGENELLSQLANERDAADLLAWQAEESATPEQKAYWAEMASLRAQREAL